MADRFPILARISAFARSRVGCYSVAFLAPILAMVFRLLATPWLRDQSPLMLFIGAGAFAAWWGGLRPGLFAFAWGGVLALWMFMSPLHGLTLPDVAERTRLGLYFLVGIGICTMAEALHRAIRRAQEGERKARIARDSQELSNARVSLLAELARELLMTATPERLAKSVCAKLLAHLNADVIFNFIVDPNTGKLRLSTHEGLSEESVRKIKSAECPRAICTLAAEENKPVILDNVLSSMDEDSALLRQEKVKVLGTLGFGCRRRKRFSREEIDLIKTVVDYVVLALQRERQVRALAESEERYRAFVETSHEAIWRIELDAPIDTKLPVEEQVRLYFERGYYAEGNDALAKLYGYPSAAEVTGLRVSAVEPPNRKEHWESLRDFVQAGYRRSGEISYEFDREGEVRNFLNNYVGIVEDGFLVRIWGSSLDVTADKRAEAALRESEATLKAYYESSPACMGMVELSSNDVLHIYNNPATCAFLGMPAGSTSGRWASELGIPQDIIQTWLMHYRESAARGGPVSFDLAYKTPGQQDRWLTTTVAPIKESASGQQRFCYVSIDITARRHFEEQLARAKESAEAASRAKDEFLAALSHELRNPLNPVLLAASEARLDESLPEEEREMWDMVFRNISLQARLIDDLLDLTRVARGKLSLILREVDAHEVLRGGSARSKKQEARTSAEPSGGALAG
jgi:PAS domain S-box-containing protein